MSGQPQSTPPGKEDAGKVIVVVIGAGLVFVGLTMLAREFFWPALDLGRLWSIIRGAGWGIGLIIIGIIAIVWTQRPGFRPPAKGSRLYRSRTDRVLGGVLGGLAAYLGMDATLVRLAYAGLSLMFGVWPAIIAYIAAVIIVPEAPSDESQSEATAQPPASPAPPPPPTTQAAPPWPEGAAAPYEAPPPPPAQAPGPPPAAPTAPEAAPPAPEVAPHAPPAPPAESGPAEPE